MACDVPESCKFRSLDSCQKKFLRTHKEVDLAPCPVIGLVLQVGDTEKFPQAFGFEGPDSFVRVSEQGPCFTATEYIITAQSWTGFHLKWNQGKAACLTMPGMFHHEEFCSTVQGSQFAVFQGGTFTTVLVF